MKCRLRCKAFLSALYLLGTIAAFSQTARIVDHPEQKVVELINGKMRLALSYNNEAQIRSMSVDKQELLDAAGVYTSVTDAGLTVDSRQLLATPVLRFSRNQVVLGNIRYGNERMQITESWTFDVKPDTILFFISRRTASPLNSATVSSPVFVFKSIDTWEGAYQGYGGLAWFYLFNKPLDTYGVHSDLSEFWNSKTGVGLDIKVESASPGIAMSYTRTKDQGLDFRITTADSELTQKFDTPTFRRRFIRDGVEVWAPSKLNTNTKTQIISLVPFNVEFRYGRGNFAGVNGNAVNAVLNTIARIGVIDKEHFGGNSWHTPYGPICLHEQYIAQMGIGINDPKYLQGYQQCLDFYRDHAIKPDGRVYSRWAYTNEDMMPGEVNKEGFYEAQWGYLMDANPDLVINVAELFDQTGDLTWLKTHKQSCEKVLTWILKRDFNDNGLVEMLNNNQSEQKSSDWIDIIWASYENAFVNAKLYRALLLWANAEKQLGDDQKYKQYSVLAEKLRVQFNKPVNEGGLWDEESKCYVHWREKDGSVHGRNMVTPVNFMAISYGICDDADRKKMILDTIEAQMVREKLFFWPLCMTGYAPGEGKEWQFPFPNYENGDIFLSWGSVAVDAYASYKPALALKYVRNVLAQYEKDGLAFQRYGRLKQDGLGDDILSGNGLSIVGLYRSIYGIQPKHNRLYLDPHITSELSGTKLKYNFRGEKLTIGLDENRYSITGKKFNISAGTSFGFATGGNQLSYFAGDSDTASITIDGGALQHVSVRVEMTTADSLQWVQLAPGSSRLKYRVAGLRPRSRYYFTVSAGAKRIITSDARGLVSFEVNAGSDPVTISLKKST